VSAESIHYANDAAEVLAEFKRVLKPSGIAVILDTPWYDREADGHRETEALIRNRVQRFDLSEDMLHRAGFLHRGGFDAAVRMIGLDYRRIPVFPGARRALQSLRSR